MLCGAALGYGLTEGGPNAATISLTKLGGRVVTPTEVDDDKRALREAALKPTVANSFYKRYDGSPLPPKKISQNVLATTLDVPIDRTSDVYDLLIENARFVGFLKKIKEKEYIDVGGPVALSSETPGYEEETDDLGKYGTNGNAEEHSPGFEERRTPSISPPAIGETKNAIFVGHGGNRKPMEQLTKILSEYRIPYKATVEEPNRARPIPQKVAETMKECGAAVLVFTADREYFDKEGSSVWRPSENVSHELGAASVLYGERIIIFKEKGLELASNFSSVGYIEFEKDKLSDKGIELFRELVGMGILQISISG